MTRLSKLGMVLALIGVGFMVGGGIAYNMVRAGYTSLNKYSAAQDVTLSYNDDGHLVDHGSTEGADEIMNRLTNEWGYKVNKADFDPNDPIINTASEYMYQMATISTHVLDGTQKITLTEDTEYNGEKFPAGTYEFAVDGRYYSQFDRKHPLEGPARTMAWSPLAFGLIGELGVGAITASTLQLALGLSAVVGGLGLTFLLLGFGLMWASKETTQIGMRDSKSSLPKEPVGV